MTATLCGDFQEQVIKKTKTKTQGTKNYRYKEIKPVLEDGKLEQDAPPGGPPTSHRKSCCQLS